MFWYFNPINNHSAQPMALLQNKYKKLAMQDQPNIKNNLS